ncbi:uncharacterized protein Neto [Venturia canescens]|uniref:uncharacterized protein Neto n=1 Tax=Venturia canescens TaxID=32260 RepID=UPI001C9BE50E|nr:uncharacterized protein LOC122408552 [Venturia canescens]XP_043271306.1 uncharacterized protein LOC122408552 [Venturia canescens]XP_043271307.1 uncharacterized protein LOC122408552 [Venturia canescens]XP_043271308.1 uncharacterized protein LOC122408552 [Venturia canescens]XP_043271309.1 uncharacterized protein LOC122408552 [Venturia canescens]XP_043271310.1 uncharacterized protein LOC122408552 [Venturia canescens]
MCLPKAIVIVIVKSRNGEGARFKYINVRKESRMVARLPQQVFLLLVLVGGTTTGTVYRAELSSGATVPSFRRVGASAPRLSHPGNLRGQETSSRTSVRVRRSSALLDEEITVSSELPTTRNFRSSQVLSIFDAKPTLTYKRKKMKNSEGEVDRREESEEKVRWDDSEDEKFRSPSKEGLATLEFATTSDGQKSFETANQTIIIRGNPWPHQENTHYEKRVKTVSLPANSSSNSLQPSVTSPMSKKGELTTLNPPNSDSADKEQMVPIDVPPPRFLSTISLDSTFSNDRHQMPSDSRRYTSRRFDWLTSERIYTPVTTWPTTAVGFPKRYARDTEPDPCEKFLITDDVKREFYSPNYPQNYPPKANCVRTLTADKGMLLKLDFRDRFELESMTAVNDKVSECRFDYLEVRDGQYGFSNLLGVFCDKQFPPEIISKSRHLWLRFRSDDTIEYAGFKAVWSTIPRPTTGGVPPEQEPCIRNITNKSDFEISHEDIEAEKKSAIKNKVALDCLWIITAPAGTRMQATFDPFTLDKPNDCSANFLDVFDQETDIPSRLKNFCGSMAETVHSTKNIMYMRFYLEPKAINSSFKSIVTVVREKGSTDKPCRDNEYDCDDNTCIAISLKCNKRFNCRFLRDEDSCGTEGDQLDSSRVIIILVIFSLIMFGMCFTFVFNCVRKLMRDHRIIREHIRQSRENRLDEIGRKTTPCPVSLSRTDLRDHGSESPSVEVDSSKELIPTTMIAHEYTKELVLEMKYGTKEVNDIHQSNNVSNATQERLQESSEELEMCDSSCQTRESLFEPRILDASITSAPFSTFGYRRTSEGQNGVSPSHRVTPQQSEERHQHYHHHHHQHPHPPSRKCSQHSHQSHPSNSPPSRHPVSEQCSVCLSSNSREGSLVICPKHNPIPAPPGWSLHDPPYPLLDDPRPPEDVGCLTYKRYQSPKPERTASNNRNHQQHQSPVYTRQNTVGSGERYDSLIYGSARASSNAASNTTSGSNVTGSGGSQHSATPKYIQTDPRYRAEAVIEVDQKRPFSIESTKSAPDVIATH